MGSVILKSKLIIMQYTYKMGVTIRGNKIPDEGAKIITLSLKGVGYEDIAKTTFIKVNAIYQVVSFMYSFLDINKNFDLLKYCAIKDHFDYNYKCKDIELLTPEEKERLFTNVPGLRDEDT